MRSVCQSFIVKSWMKVWKNITSKPSEISALKALFSEEKKVQQKILWVLI